MVQLDTEFPGTDRFHIRRRLGAGSFGVVYEVLDREHDAVIALKALRRVDDAGALYRFKQEFRTLADVSHENLVTLHELLADDGRWLLTMEVVRGVDIIDYIRPHDRAGSEHAPTSSPRSDVATLTASLAPTDTGSPAAPSPDRAVDPSEIDRLRATLPQLAAGTAALHQQGILHRDIKPSNILVTEGGRVVILDFGLAMPIAPGGSTDTLRLAGTPAYMAPEQASRQPASEASDWYSVGVVLYRALTGVLPFSGDVLQLLRDKRDRDPTPPSTLVKGVPENLETLCLELLRRAPSARPLGLDILVRLGGTPSRRTVAGFRAPASPSAFVGRADQLRVLRRGFDEMSNGRTAVICVHGRSGLGKTALIRQFLRTLPDPARDTVVLQGRCFEQEAVPFKALDSVVDALSQYLRRLPPDRAELFLPRGVTALARVFPVLGQVSAIVGTPRREAAIPDTLELRRRAFCALRELLGRLAERSPLVLVIDDLQWGDADSADLLRELLRPPDAPSLLLVVGYRSEDASTSPTLARLVPLRELVGSEAHLGTAEVSELSSAESRELAISLVGPGTDGVSARASRIAKEARGNPFFIAQLAHHGEVGDPESSLERLLDARAAGLPSESRRLLEVTAVAGRPVPLSVATQAAALDSSDYDVLAPLRAGQFIRTAVIDGDTQVEPYHDRIREAIAAALSQDARREHHNQLALALEATGQADPEALARHFEGAGDLARAARYAEAAADQASEALAFDRAAELYRRAQTLRPPPATAKPTRPASTGWEHRRSQELSIALGDRRDELSTGATGLPIAVKLGDAIASAGRPIDAARVYRGAVTDASPTEQLELNRLAAEQLLLGGHVDQGLILFRHVLAAVGLRLASTHRRALLSFLFWLPYRLLRGIKFRERTEDQVPAADLLRIDFCRSACRAMSNTEIVRTVELQTRHLLLALRAGEPTRIALALAFQAVADAASPSSRRRGRRLLTRAGELAGDHPRMQGLLKLSAGMMAMMAGHWREGREQLDEAEQIFRERCAGVATEVVTCRVYALECLFESGEFREFRRRVPDHLREARERGNLYGEVSMRIHLASVTCFADDAPQAAVDDIDAAMSKFSTSRATFQRASSLYRQGEFLLYAGPPDTAWLFVTSRWSTAATVRFLEQSTRMNRHDQRARGALAAAAAGTDPRTTRSRLRLAEADARRLEREGVAWGRPLGALIRAGIASCEDDQETAVGWLRRAEAGFGEGEMKLRHAAARRRLGALTGGSEGRELVEAADRWMSEQGFADPERTVGVFAPGRWHPRA